MKKYFPLVALLFVIFLACEPREEQISNLKSMELRFSTDTVLFDTLITDRLSLTRRFRIFNPNDRAVEVTSIRLGRGASSEYSIIVNGKEGPEVTNEVIFGGDSIMVLVSVDIDPQDENLPYIIKDSVVVEWNQNSEDVKLISWGQDAHYVHNQVICDETWTADRPYVIHNLAVVDSLCVLTVEPGTRIYLDNGASLIVEGTLKILGDSAGRVTIRNTRFDENYQQVPGQWNSIVFMETSTENVISYCDIENGEIGLGVGYAYAQLTDGSTILLPESSANTVDVQIDHTSIRHMSTAGILAFSSDIHAYNTEVYNAGAFLIGNLAGGIYRYEHCTFSNQPSFFINEDPMVQFSDNLQLTEKVTLTGDLDVEIVNSIIWGPGQRQFDVSESTGTIVRVNLDNNIIRSKDPMDGNFTSLEDNFPGFADPFDFDYRLDSLAFARDKGKLIGTVDDLEGKPRDDKPDIGAFERIDRE